MITTFNQSYQFMQINPQLLILVSLSNYKSISENVVGASKIYLTAINGLKMMMLGLSKSRNLSSKRLRGFERGKVGPVDGTDHVGGNYAASLNFEASFPKNFT